MDFVGALNEDDFVDLLSGIDFTGYDDADTFVNDEEDDDRPFVEGIDFVGGELTEVGRRRFGRRLRKRFKKFGRRLKKIAKGVVKFAAKIVPSPYNVAFKAALNIGSAIAHRRNRGRKALRGLARLAKRGDRKAHATLNALRIAHRALRGKPAAGLALIAHARHRAKAKHHHAARHPHRGGHPQRAQHRGHPHHGGHRGSGGSQSQVVNLYLSPPRRQRSAPHGTYEVRSPEGRRFSVKLPKS